MRDVGYVLLPLVGYALGVALARRRERRMDRQLFDLLRPGIHNKAAPTGSEFDWSCRDQRDHE